METVVRNVYLMSSGTLTVEGSTIVPGLCLGESKDVPVQYFLLETSRGYILVDTGNDPGVIEDPAGTWGEEFAAACHPNMAAEHHPMNQLALCGIAPEDVKMVVYTHLHCDHGGAGLLYPEAIHVVQRAEYRWAFAPDRTFEGPYLPTNVRSRDTLNWQFAEGDWALLPGVHLVSTPGHTPGHQSVVLWDTPNSGTVILAGDAVITQEAVDRNAPPGANSDATTAVRSMHRLTALAAAADGMLLTGHDAEFNATLPRAPKALSEFDVSTRRFYQRGLNNLYGAAGNPDNLLN